MRRLLFVLSMAIFFFVLLNFIYCNLDSATFGYEVMFKFNIPYLFSVQSVPISMGFVLLVTFCFGMVAIGFLEALPSFFKTLEIRAKKKRIRQLERELSVIRSIASANDSKPLEKSSSDIKE